MKKIDLISTVLYEYVRTGENTSEQHAPALVDIFQDIFDYCDTKLIHAIQPEVLQFLDSLSRLQGGDVSNRDHLKAAYAADFNTLYRQIFEYKRDGGAVEPDLLASNAMINFIALMGGDE